MDDLNNDGSAAFDGMGGLQMMGIMNALKTGNVHMDMLIAMCIPIVLKLVFDSIYRISGMLRWESWLQWLSRPKDLYQRSIAYKSTRNSWGGSTSWDNDTQNTVLIKAIQLYMHHQLEMDYLEAGLDLTSMEDKGSSLGCYRYDDDDDDSDAEGSSSRKTLVGVLSKYKIIKRPPEGVWHNLGCYGSKDKADNDAAESSAPVKLMILRNEESLGSDKDVRHCSTLTYHFASPSKDAIDTFVDTAYRWYMEQLRSLEDNSRYLYELSTLSAMSHRRDDDESGGNSDALTYKRYKLSDEKTFASLFFPDKEPLLNLMDHFMNKTGKYAIPGYPHKLGVLLHGPPGTGKTSLIKALAQATGRSIVNVPLARISTNSELMSIFFDRKYYVQGEAVPVRLSFKDVIFVMEDVDAASKVVRRRDGKTTAEMVQTEEIELPLPKSMWRMLLESSDENSQELVEELMSKSQRLKEEATKPDVLVAIASRMMTVPGLDVVGSQSNGDFSSEKAKALERIGDKAVASANTILDNFSTLDRFVGFHANAVKRLLDAGAEVDDDFVDYLLGNSFSMNGVIKAPPRANISRDVSLSQPTATEDVHVIGSSNWSTLHDNEKKNTDNVVWEKGEKKETGTGFGPLLKPDLDQLNLTGLLNVLDGVVDTPGRILIMTTNHPEMLDPALIRPGRIDKRIMLGYMKGADVVSMLEHYFQANLTPDQRRRVEVAINGDHFSHPQVRMTPAQVEQMTAEHDDIEDMIQALEAKSNPIGTSGQVRGVSVATITYNV